MTLTSRRSARRFHRSQPSHPSATNAPWSSVMMPALTSPDGNPGPPPAPPKKTDSTMVGRAWNNVVDTFSGSPNPRPNPSTAAGPAYGTSGVPTGVAGRFPTAPGMPNQAAPRVYTSPPAYRWFSWGTPTPGQNAYAPDGQSYRAVRPGGTFIQGQVTPRSVSFCRYPQPDADGRRGRTADLCGITKPHREPVSARPTR